MLPFILKFSSTSVIKRRDHMVKSLPRRSEVPAEETWDLNSLFASDKEFNAALESLQQEVAGFQKQFKGNIQDAASVVEVLTSYLALLEKLVPISTYASLSLSTDQTDDEAQMRS